MHVSRFDLNLFVVFDAIYTEGSLTRAARVLNLTQPAVSHALARLRERLEDPLFVRQGARMVPTSRARAMVTPVRHALGGLQRCLSHEGGFDLGEAERTFVLGLRDGLEGCLLPPLISALVDEAPGIRLQSMTVPRRQLATELASGRLDLATDILLPLPESVQHRRVMQGPLVVLMREGHPLAGNLDLPAYLAAQHVLVSSRREGPGMEDFGLSRLGYRRHIRLRCQHHQAALSTVMGSDLLLTLPELLARQLAPKGAHTEFLPVDIPGLELHLYWHRDQSADPGHSWLRQKVMAVMEQLSTHP
ncbi:Transcriptional regulator, LysR family [Alloalcanivorax dieselolei B5]|uniref:Transcriptional regulator, LysR family n=1 Tax=Alcanivorax dieselolei (strain DSM 16502 / CGMCC 1.3690 / MCCC 1A00001 / B-5) TaxID=930169 RepID=K0CIF9_ALCDB|nr:LysR family transcriptional regulator [Alloalcanivorax dieselolei]AFT72433.1 Transcriptional regulator, LysR family [Alloalcanivorax dieselolei B5]GGJ77796.1 transcriptional regulator [Alloalcanivorax dieselolei]